MRILVFGDSITWGVSDMEKGGWVERLKIHFFESGKDIDIYNLGISGNVTKEVLERVDTECVARDPQSIIFSIGINDTQFLRDKSSVRISQEVFEENISLLIEGANRYSSHIVFIGLTRVDESKASPLSWNSNKEYHNDLIERYDTIIQNTAEKNGCRYVSMKDVLDVGDLSDGVHPNSKGHRKIAEAILESQFWQEV